MKANFAVPAAALFAVFAAPTIPAPGAETKGPGLARVFDPPRLPADARLGKPRDLNGYFPWAPIVDRAAWGERAREVREQILVAAGLWPLPERCPLDPVIHGEIDRGDYTVAKVFLRSYPGFYVTGNLYRPKVRPEVARGGRRPAVLSPHGHWENGRMFERGLPEAQREIESGAEKTMEGARFPLQARCAQLARMGCVVFHYDMVGVADSKQIGHAEGFRDPEAVLRGQSAFGLQTWDSIRALDFLAGLPDVDPARIGVTGASGGGTQTFILCAIDDRPAVAFPAVMVSTAMQGGCVCENAPGLRVGTGNIEFAALCAPRPLGMSAANDWTLEIETKGLPELKKLYEALGVPDLVAAKCFPQFGHNYNRVSREVMYGWMNRHLGLGLADPVREAPFQPVPPAELSVFDADHPRPSDAVDAAGLRRWMTEASDRQMAALRPRDAATLAEFRRAVGTGLRGSVVDRLPGREDVEVRTVGGTYVGAAGDRKFFAYKLLIGRRGSGEAVPAVRFAPSGVATGRTTVIVDPAGKEAALLDAGGDLQPVVARLLEGRSSVLAIDPLLTGEYGLPGRGAPPRAVNEEYPGYTFGYNRTLLAERVHDVLTAIAVARYRDVDPGGEPEKVSVLGVGAAGPWVLLAAALAGPAVERSGVDLDRFSFAGVKRAGDPMMLPGALKYGGVPAFAALCAPGRLWAWAVPPGMDLAGDAYRAAGAEGRLRVDAGRPDGTRLADWLADRSREF